MSETIDSRESPLTCPCCWQSMIQGENQSLERGGKTLIYHVYNCQNPLCDHRWQITMLHSGTNLADFLFVPTSHQ